MMIKKKFWKDGRSAIAPIRDAPPKYSTEELQLLVGNNPVDLQRALDAQVLQEKLHKAFNKVALADSRPVKRMPSWMR